MRRRRRSVLELWQSFADLAMGLMAMLTLILLMLLENQQQELEDIRREKQELEQEKQELEKTRKDLATARDQLKSEQQGFAVELMKLFDRTYAIVADQDQAERMISGLFDDTDCQLMLGPTGALEVRPTDKRSRAATGLYDVAATSLSAEGQAALSSCQESFIRLAYCMSPVDAGAVPEATRAARQATCLAESGFRPEVVERLREGVEALVLEGSTDSVSFGGAPGLSGGGQTPLGQTGFAFASNAYLGAERARQALAYLLRLVQGRNADPWDAFQVLLSRVVIESSSFGRYQAGPPEWRTPGCGASPDCAAARNLNMRIRWRKSELREPLEEIREEVCRLARNPDSALYRGLSAANEGADAFADRLGCPARASGGASPTSEGGTP